MLPASSLRQALAVAVLSLVAALPARAQFTQTLPQFNGTGALGVATVGSFTGVPTTGITSATITGFFGNSTVPNTAPDQLFLDGVLIATCLTNATCTSSQTPTSFSFTFLASDFGIFADGGATLTVNQTNSGVVRLGQTTLTVNTTSTPEPASLVLLGTGLVGVLGAGYRRRRNMSL